MLIHVLFFAVILGNFSLTMVVYYLCNRELRGTQKKLASSIDVMYDKLISRSIVTRSDINALNNNILTLENKLDAILAAAAAKKKTKKVKETPKKESE